jgi:arylsulfatase A-like enzyme
MGECPRTLMADISTPHVLLVILDDQQVPSLGYMGSTEVRTPHLDRLASSGTILENCFVTTPICTPGRAEILTGCDSYGNGVPWFSYPIDSKLTLISTAFRQAGFHTAYFGKWHNDGHPSERDFEFTRRTMHEARDFYRRYPAHGHDLIFDEEGGEVRGHSTELFTDATIEWLDQQRDAARPWFACLAYHSPHDPFQPPEPHASDYPAATAQLPASFSPVHPLDNGDLTIRDELNLPWPRTPEAIRQYRAGYHGMVAHTDACIGRVLAALERNGQRENTIVVFTSDHGLAVGCHGLLGKENMYDHSTRVPLLFSGPGVKAGQRLKGLCRNTDIYPTLCRLSGIDIPASVKEGRDLSGPLGGTGQGEAFRECVFSQFSSPAFEPDETGFLPLKPTQRMARTGRWKLMFYPQIRRYQLFDLETDPDETLDLLAGWLYRPYQWGRKPNPLHAFPPADAEPILAVAEGMRQRLRQHLQERNDSALPLLDDTPLELVPGLSPA